MWDWLCHIVCASWLAQRSQLANEMPHYIVNEEAEETLLATEQDERGKAVLHIANEIRKTVAHIAEAGDLPPMPRIQHQIASGYLPEQLPNGTNTFDVIQEFYESMNNYIHQGDTDYVKTSDACMDILTELSQFASMLSLIDDVLREKDEVYAKVEEHLRPLVRDYLEVDE
ncbi:hypothetical protein BC938DRAFT_474233 [Jimgerdemannia flammicorona]|uniref:Uncharacterized protein n=1 Tax=Jimgerdemannia flammicorona TaxID=994334 RepID=A0A433Q2I5_9FUNG|nr:hypothetical protein BC938DRAFT_474233 [Jimgerdemannia flammicorona]